MKLEDISPRLKELAGRADEVDTCVAIDLLITIYLDNCGISISTRTVAENASFFWIERWKKVNHELPEEPGIYDVMQIRSEEYRKYKEQYDEYDITYLNSNDLQRICLEMIDETSNLEEQIALAAGVVDYLTKIR